MNFFLSNRNIFEIFICDNQIVYMSYLESNFKIENTRVITIKNDLNRQDLERRYRKMREDKVKNIEQIKDELEDDYSDDSLFNITSWGADLSFRELVSMYEDDELVKPELQRKYVWDKMEASRFVESILLGLPIPSIFLAQTGSQKLIVDGYQRIMTVYDYMRGIFSTDNKIFKLSNSERINERWRNKSFVELSIDDQRKIKSTTIHAIIFEQKKPENDDTSLYQIFERINTSGRTLTPQEIRNCVSQGSFNSMLFELNKDETWRELFGTRDEDSRMRDLELILRFFVFKDPRVLNVSMTQISLKKKLNEHMELHKNDSKEEIERYSKEFLETISFVMDHIGIHAFKNYIEKSNKFSNKFHPAIYDAIMIAAFKVKEMGKDCPRVSDEVHKSIFENSEFKNAISNHTTNIENIKARIRIAANILFGVDLL